MLGIGLAAGLGACGGGGGGGDDDGPADASIPDGPPADAVVGDNPAFVAPTVVTGAYDGATRTGDADWTCLGTASGDTPTTVAVTVGGVVSDLQDASREVRDATVAIFGGSDLDAIAATSAATGVDGVYSVVAPAGHARYGVRVAATGYQDTLRFGIALAPSTPSQTLALRMVSTPLANALEAFVGRTHQATEVQIFGELHDCAGASVGGAIATVSGSPTAVEHYGAIATYYLDGVTGQPVRGNQLAATDASGGFFVFGLPATAQAYVQVWGYPTAADLAAAQLVLLGVQRIEATADSFVMTSLEPRRAP
ncbi:MAG: hypothetical protein H6709_16295 [Kofleriaceae bacterium]|nr:hypothetical protein [Myxococcales bacterium]MCB9563351.1 hypothetical protein [Kofleriaceae bacterium]MCB9573641.1 hypothetical protein [Kofleriaceae bacterium]